MTPGVLVEEGRRCGWGLAEATAAYAPDSTFPAGFNFMSKVCLHFSCSLLSCLPLFHHLPLYHVLPKVPEGAKARWASCPGEFQFYQPILRARGQELLTELSSTNFHSDMTS